MPPSFLIVIIKIQKTGLNNDKSYIICIAFFKYSDIQNNIYLAQMY